MTGPSKNRSPIAGVQFARRCASCPPDQVCAWACEQGWGETDILAYKTLVLAGILPATDTDSEANAYTHQVFRESYN